MIKRIIKKYVASISTESIPYTEYNHLRSSAMSAKPVLWIPNWNFIKKSSLEIILDDYYGLFYGDTTGNYFHSDQEKIEIREKDLFKLLSDLECEWTSISKPAALFYFGLLSYDLFRYKQQCELNQNFYNLPDFYYILPGNGYLIDHSNHTILRLKISAVPMKMSIPSENFMSDAPGDLKEPKENYLNKIQSIQDLITEGEVYQVNYTTRFSAGLIESGFDFFRALYLNNQAPFSVYASLHRLELISNSPERFLMMSQSKVQTEPIKGTIRHDDNPQIDDQLKQQLQNSEKDSAELNMIVDLMRNDISTVCLPGTVEVTEHKRLETFRNVHHLVSTIRGHLAPQNSFINLLQNTFPGGSITGCPKSAALKYINQLEEHNRSFYTGSFFIRFPDENTFDSNILIRTAIKQNNNIHFQAGGGIVIDSTGESEYAECLAKADTFFKTLEQINARNDKQ